MTDRPLAGRSAIVTGASAGIGEAIALHLSSLGAGVVVNARRAERVEALAQRITDGGGQAIAVVGDAVEHAVIDAMFGAAKEMGSHHASDADIVVANAGRGLAGSVLTSDEGQWEEMIRVNLLGCARLVREAGKRMIKDAAGDVTCRVARDIVVLGSNVGRHVSPFSSMYGSTKFAVNSLAEGARREMGPKGVRVSLLEPGIVVSEFQQVAGYDQGLTDGFEAKFGPLLEPMDVARTVGFIVSQPGHVHVNDVVIRATRQDYP